MSEQRCGTCKWWDRWKFETDRGDCIWDGVIPISLGNADRPFMKESAGFNCPCYEKIRVIVSPEVPDDC